MDLYVSGNAVDIRYPSGLIDAQHLAEELAAHLDEIALAPSRSFSSAIAAGIPATDVDAIYVGRQDDWALELGLVRIPWWDDEHDFGIRVVSGSDCLNPACSGHELHIIARDYQLLLRAVWLTLHGLGWRHFLPNGVPGLEDLWIVKKSRHRIRTRVNRVWAGAVDHLLPSIAGGTSNLGWSDGTNHASPTFPNGLREGDLTGAIGDRPLVETTPEASWLRHMAWTASSSLQANAAWPAIIAYDAAHGARLAPWDAATGLGHYADDYKLFTDSPEVQQVALDYANSKVSGVGLEWVSLSRPDGDSHWDIDFGDPVFGAKRPVRRQIELANVVAASPDYDGVGIVIQAYGLAAETPTDDVWPHSREVCVVVMEAYRPPGKTVEAIIDDYVDASGQARCPLGIYQYLNTAAWGQGVITAKAAAPRALVDSVNRIRRLPAVSPKVVTGESMTEFGLFGIGYYGYMRMVLDVGRVSSDFTLADWLREARQFLRNAFPTRQVRAPIRRWYRLLIDLEHKPLLSSDLMSQLWDALADAMTAVSSGSLEELRIVELCKFTRYLDLRNAYEAAEAAGLASEDAYDALLEWLFRIRDSGLVEIYSFFQTPLNETHHAALGLTTIWEALHEPPGAGRGANGTRPAWTSAPPTVDDFCDPDTNWLAEGLANNIRHGLIETTFSTVLVGGWVTDPRGRQPDVALHPYRADGKMRVWLIPGAASFECAYRVDAGGAYVEFVNQLTGAIDAGFAVLADATVSTTLTVGQLYEIRLTTYATSNRIWLDWWTPSTTRHSVSFDPGRGGDPAGFGATTGRSLYFLVPDGVSEIHFYAAIATELQLFVVDALGVEQQDLTFTPGSRSYQTHAVAGTGRRILRIAGIQSNEIGFWLLNCPNLLALHPEELLKPADA